ncbi:hypothetical protein M2392_004527 [Pseudomonas grimontii]|nr:hypothetical protein [Pseudomonas grimontii]MCS3514475.1 hypothetical protein [Pseudomonas grimontii]
MESFWLCDDCLFATTYEDYSTLSLYYTADEIEKRIAGRHLGLVRLNVTRLPLQAMQSAAAVWR